MKLNANYSLSEGTFVDPVYLGPSFDILSDDQDTLTSTTKIKRSTTTAIYSSTTSSHVATSETGIVMDLGSLKNIVSLRIKGVAGIEYGSGVLSSTSSTPSILWISDSLGATKSFVNNKFIPGNVGIYTTSGDLEYLFVDDSYNCSSAFPTPVPTSGPKFFDTNKTAKYRIQYSITGNAYLDFQENILSVPDGQNLDLTINIPSSIGAVRYIRLSCLGSAANPIVGRIAFKSNSTNNTPGISIIDTSNSGLTVASTDNTTPIYVQGSSDIDYPPYATLDLGSLKTIDTIGYKFANNTSTAGYQLLVSSDNISYTNAPILSTSTTTNNVVILNLSTISTRYIKLPVYAGWNGAKNYYGYYTTFWVGRKNDCLRCYFSPSTTLNVSGGSIIDSFLTLSSFYADDGITPAVITVSNISGNTAINGIAMLIVTASVTQGATLNYQWQKKESGASSFANIPGANSGTLTLTGLTNAADNGDQYQVILSANGANSVTSSPVTLVVPAPTIAITDNTPTTITTSANGTATLSVSVSVSEGILPTFQWQKKENGASSFTNIANATSSTLNLTGLTNSVDNGDQYQVIISANGANSVTSNITTLNVPTAPTLYTLSSLINSTPAVLYNNQIQEGQTLLININASKAPETFTSSSLTLYWRRINSGQSAVDNDFNSAIPGGAINMIPVGSSATPQAFNGQLSINPKEDNLTEGNENFIVVFFDDNNFSNEVVRTPVFTILDTSTGGVAPIESQTPTPPATPTPTKPVPSSTRDEQGCFIVAPKLPLSQTPTRTQTGTPTTTPTSTPASTPPYTPLATQTPTRTKTPRVTVTPTNNPTNTPRLSQTPTQTQTPTKTSTQTPTNTCTPTNTGTSQQTPTPTTTSTVTRSQTPSPTATPGPTATQTGTPTNTPSASLTPTPSPTAPPCDLAIAIPVACPPCNAPVIIGYNEFIDPRCGPYSIPIYECVYMPYSPNCV